MRLRNAGDLRWRNLVCSNWLKIEREVRVRNFKIQSNVMLPNCVNKKKKEYGPKRRSRNHDSHVADNSAT